MIDAVKEEGAMSSKKHEMWLDRWWPVLLIGFGLIFISALAFFKPSY